MALKPYNFTFEATFKPTATEIPMRKLVNDPGPVITIIVLISLI